MKKSKLTNINPPATHSATSNRSHPSGAFPLTTPFPRLTIHANLPNTPKNATNAPACIASPAVNTFTPVSAIGPFPTNNVSCHLPFWECFGRAQLAGSPETAIKGKEGGLKSSD